MCLICVHVYAKYHIISRKNQILLLIPCTYSQNANIDNIQEPDWPLLLEATCIGNEYAHYEYLIYDTCNKCVKMSLVLLLCWFTVR